MFPSQSLPQASDLFLSVVVPVKNESGNIATLIAELEAAMLLILQSLHKMPLEHAFFEIIYVNDGSTDDTAIILADLAKRKSHLRILEHTHSCGQSAAVRSGVWAARGHIVVTLDGDGQNNPAFIPALVTAFTKNADGTVGLVQGQRMGRKDTGFKKIQSKIANKVRNFFLQDGTRDSGCGLKCFPRALYLRLPYFDALHRFMPALILREGYTLAYIDVVDRPRFTGVSNYGFFDRLWVGILDLLGVWWLIKRRKRIPQGQEIKIQEINSTSKEKK
jgi:dolichol-phosphate mannosyltransferase